MGGERAGPGSKPRMHRVDLTIFAAFFLLTLLTVAFVAPFMDFYAKAPQTGFGIICLVLACALMSALLLLVGRHGRVVWHSRKAFGGTVLLAGIVVFVLQVFLIRAIYFHAGWDVWGLTTVAASVSSGTPLDDSLVLYVNRYPNNGLLITIFSLLWDMACGIGKDFMFLAALVGAASVTLTQTFMVLIVRRLTKDDVVTIVAWALFLLLFGLSPWISIPYSDTYAMVFPAAALYLFLLAPPGKGGEVARWAGIGLFCYVGFLMKPTIVFVLVAIIIVELVRVFGRDGRPGHRLKAFRDFAVCGILPMAISIGLIACAVVPMAEGRLSGIPADEEARFTSDHFLMMGLNEVSEGGFSVDDVVFSGSYRTVAQRVAANRKVIEERITSDPAGIAALLVKKNMTNYHDGTFAWYQEGDVVGFCQEELPSMGPAASFLREIFSYDGAYQPIWRMIVQVLWFVVLIGQVLVIFCKDGQPSMRIIHVCVLVLLVLSAFLMLFECRARYLLCYSSFFIVVFSVGMSAFSAWLRERRLLREGRLPQER